MTNQISNLPGQPAAANSGLSAAHRAQLGKSAITDSVIAARGYRSIHSADELEGLGFASGQRRVPGLLLPLHSTDGGSDIAVYRPDNPRVVDERNRASDGQRPSKVVKYEYPKGAPMRIDCPPPCRSALADPRIPLWITEGQKKADALASAGQCAVALLGAWNFKGKNSQGGITLLADWDHIALNGRTVRIVFDSDASTKPAVQAALSRLCEHLQRKVARVSSVALPASPDGSKQGVDDYLAAGHSLSDLADLPAAPAAAHKPADPTSVLLDEEPFTISRPLTLIAGRAYAATWLTVQETRSESYQKGQVVRHNPPKVITERRLFIIRDDGAIYGDGAGCAPLGELGLMVHLPEIPPADKLWTTKAVKAYQSGARVDAAQVFEQVVDIVSRFIDFERSLAEQRTMAEMVACYILATWFLDGFNVIGFLWPNGDRGSGKTQLLTIICELSYLGQVILAGGSFASLRDMADYGATLGFDDAEQFSDPKRSDPDKRNLLLAGNRRGSTVSVKEPGTDRQWRTRYVNTFCPRLFSATMLPDPILSSRTIVVPLIRTADRFRANSDPKEFWLWPHDRRALLSDLWALALANLAELPTYESLVNEAARLSGRSLERWRALLAVALWLDGEGVQGLWGRMEELSFAYWKEQPALETGDLTALTLMALCNLVAREQTRESGLGAQPARQHTFATKTITQEVVRVAEETEADIDCERITSRRVGRTLGKLRLRDGRDPGNQVRQWQVKIGELAGLATSYGLTHSANALNVHNVRDVTPPGESDAVSDITDIKDIKEVSDEAGYEEGEV